MSIEDFRRLKPKKRNKYGAKGQRVDGIYFDSQKELKHYGELKMRKLAGDIKEFTVHPVFDLIVNGVLICKYELDFKIIHNDGSIEYIDVKSAGTLTELHRIRKNLLIACYGVKPTILV